MVVSDPTFSSYTTLRLIGRFFLNQFHYQEECRKKFFIISAASKEQRDAEIGS